MARREEECKRNIADTVDISERAGFVIHPTKSVLTPTQKILYLGFWLDSVNMTVKLKEKKSAKTEKCMPVAT